MKTEPMKKSTESGSALFYILIAVALLAALSYTVARTGRGNIGQLNEERARVYATQILEYGNTLSSAVAQLRLRGCSETEISFENNVNSNYTNSGAPSDGSCNVFSVNGGGVQWQKPDEEWLDTSIPDTSNDYGDILITASACIQGMGKNSECNLGLGSKTPELLFIIPFLKIEICNQINELLGYSFTSPPKNNTSAWLSSNARYFKGSYSGYLIIKESPDPFEGKSKMCFEGKSDLNGYHYYQVLWAR